MRFAPSLLAVAALLSCAVERDDGLGTSCDEDSDCPDGYFCGGDRRGPPRDPLICVPEADCDPDAFGAACAGPGFYSCVDDQVHFTHCDSDEECQDGQCVDAGG